MHVRMLGLSGHVLGSLRLTHRLVGLRLDRDPLIFLGVDLDRVLTAFIALLAPKLVTTGSPTGIGDGPASISLTWATIAR